MAIVDGDRDEIVIRILYDGPARAGKTTSIKALQKMLAARRRSDLFTPEEAEGRTLYFDWMDYLGGWCDGHQVRCQIVSAPGQRSLVERRKLLLRDADVVVFVAESTSAGADAAAESYAELNEFLAGTTGPTVPVVMQANKQDLQAALPVDELRERFSQERHLAIIGSAASNGIGVREAFTFAVRLALDRVRELTKEGRLPVGEPEIRTGEDLLSWIEGVESAGAARSLAEPDSPRLPAADPRRAPEATFPASQGELTHVDVTHPKPTFSRKPERELATERDRVPEASVPAPPREGEAAPALPTSSAPSGLVWRPMEGRIILHELEDAAAELRRQSNGGWVGEVAGRWHLASQSSHAYPDLEEGRRHLLETARLHSALESVLSERRALTLTETGHGGWRLWNIVRRETSLEDRLNRLLTQLDGEGAEELFELADALVCAAERFADARAPFRATLGTVGEFGGGLCFVGVVPDVSEMPASGMSREGPEALVRAAFGRPLEKASREQRIDAPAALARLRTILKVRPERSGVVEALAAMLIGH